MTSRRYIAEMQIGADTREEYLVSNASSDIFYSYNRSGSNSWTNSGYVWTQFSNQNNQGIGDSYYNYLQPAVAHLGYNRDDAYSATNPNGNNLNNGSTTALSYKDTIWGRTVYQMTGDAFDYGTPKDINGKAINDNFNNNPVNPVDQSFSYTNVALYTMDGEEVLLSTAAQKATDRTGNQLYRTVDGIAATVAGGKNAGAYEVKNMADWQTWYLANITGASPAGFNTWFYNLLNNDVDGNGRVEMYEVYATDYVQLVTNQDYPAGNRHFTIAADYNTKYFTNSNTYVDAVDGTEFYIVGPNKVLHVVGYSNLPAIDDSTIRAAYAVAKNTAEDQDSRDYWVADVIVIEVNDIASDFDSISLMYYNPNENFNSVRYIKSLNDSWRSLQPDYENKAMMDVVPSSVSGGGSSAWGNHSWTAGDYGFYFLYNTDLQSEGSLTAGNAKKVVRGEYNRNGIFAATVSRIEDLLPSGYIDVVYNEGGVEKHQYLTVSSSAYETPVYRISTDLGVTSAGEITLDNSIKISDVEPGDKIIYVYKHGENGRQLSYIVDIAQNINNDGIDENHIPAWLCSLVNGLWLDIDTEQRGTNIPVEPENVNVNIELAAGETATFKQEGHADQTLTTSGTATLKVPAGVNTMTFQVEVPATVALAAITPDGWRMAGAERDGNVYTIYMIRNSVPAPALLSANAEEELAGTIYTVKAVEAMIAEADELNTAIQGGDASADNVAAADALIKELTAVKANLVPGDENTITETALNAVVDPDTAGSLADTVGDINEAKKTAVEAVMAKVEEAVGDYADDAKVAEAIKNIKTAMEACDTGDEVTAKFMSSGALNVDEPLVKALNDAIAQAEANDANQMAQELLKQARDKAKAALVTAAGSFAAYDNVKTVIAKYNGLIDACTAITGDADVATALSTYWTQADGLKGTAKTEIEAAVAAAEALKDEVDLAKTKEAAIAAIDGLLNGFESEGITTAVNTLTTKINACVVGGTDATLITTYYADGVLKTSQTEVAAVVTAVLTQAKAEVATAITAAIGGKTSDAITAAKTALEAKITACTTLTGEADVETALSTYWTKANGLVKTQEQVKALLDAVAAVAETPTP